MHVDCAGVVAGMERAFGEGRDANDDAIPFRDERLPERLYAVRAVECLELVAPEWVGVRRAERCQRGEIVLLEGPAVVVIPASLRVRDR